MTKPLITAIHAIHFYPSTDDPEEKARAQSFLRLLFLSGIVVDVLGSALQALTGAGLGNLFAFNGALLVSFVAGWVALSRGHPGVASFILVLTLWVYTTLALYWFGGVVNPLISIFIILILIAGTLLGPPGIYVMTALSTLSVAALVVVESTGNLPAPLTVPNALRAGVAFVTILLTSTAIMYVWYASTDKARQRARQEIADRRRAEEALRESEEKYRLLSSLSADYVFFTRIDEDGSLQLEWVAGAFEPISGYSYQEFLATGGWRAHLYPGDYEQDDEDMRQLRANKRVTTEVRIVRKDGSLRWVRTYAHPVWDEVRNTLAGIYGAVTDITDEKLAQAHEQTRREMLERVIELGKIITQINDPPECWRAIHQAVQSGLGFDRVGLFRYREEDHTVRGTFGTRDSGEIEDTSHFVQSIDQYDIWQMVLRDPKGMSMVEDFQQLMNPDAGSEMYGVGQHVTLAAWAGDKPVGLIAVDNKISGRRISQEQVEALQFFAGYAGLALENARLHSGLEERVSQRTAELETALAELEGFSYSVSHDLRSPLRAISGYARIITLEHEAELSHDVLASLEKIQGNARNLGQLVDDLLAFSRIGRQELRKHVLNMNDVVEEALREAQAGEQDGRQIKVIRGDLPASWADPPLLKLALRHILSNALKYTRARSRAIIEVGAYAEGGRTIYFVRDNGIGFDMKYASALFGIFNRLHDDQDLEGTGVGLAIAQRVFQKHGGTIWAESQPDAGATFYFTLGE